jgi:hypothetical protein
VVEKLEAVAKKSGLAPSGKSAARDGLRNAMGNLQDGRAVWLYIIEQAEKR